jgi:ATP-dependent RNA helicase SUPV3L1/SUV3
MMGHASGMIGPPMKLLVRAIYERIDRPFGAITGSLITREETIISPVALRTRPEPSGSRPDGNSKPLQ